MTLAKYRSSDLRQRNRRLHKQRRIIRPDWNAGEAGFPSPYVPVRGLLDHSTLAGIGERTWFDPFGRPLVPQQRIYYQERRVTRTKCWVKWLLQRLMLGRVADDVLKQYFTAPLSPVRVRNNKRTLAKMSGRYERTMRSRLATARFRIPNLGLYVWSLGISTPLISETPDFCHLETRSRYELQYVFSGFVMVLYIQYTLKPETSEKITIWSGITTSPLILSLKRWREFAGRYPQCTSRRRCI